MSTVARKPGDLSGARHPHASADRAGGEGDAAVEVRRLRESDVPAVVALLQRAFGRWPRLLDGEADAIDVFRWKHLETPFGEALLLVAERDGALAGFQSRLAWRMRSGSQIFHSMRGTDLAVSPAFRNQGVSMAIRAAASYREEVSFTWGTPNAQSRRGSVKFGRTEVGTIPTYLRPCKRLGVRLSRRLRRMDGEPSSHDELTVDAPAAAEVLADRGRVEEVLDSVEDPPGRLSTDRDLEYLCWRYARHGRYWGVLGEGPAPSLAIFRMRGRGSLALADVCELLVPGHDRRAARQLLARVARTVDVDALSCCFTSPAEAALHGFAFSHRGPQLVSMPLREGLWPDPTRPDSWALSRGDLELL